MSFKFYTISTKLRDSIDRSLDRGLHKQKIRPYFLGLKYDGYHVLLPLRSNCPKRYSVAIDHPDPTKENHGIDCTTMLLLRNRELNTMAKEIQLHPYEVAENVKINIPGYTQWRCIRFHNIKPFRKRKKKVSN